MSENEKEEKNTLSEISFLERLFYLGFVKSKPIRVYNDEEKGVEISVEYRTLTPKELRDVVEEMQKYESPLGRIITEKIETLARSIDNINGMPLILSQREQQEIFDKTGKTPSPLDQARIIVRDKISSLPLIDLLYDEYLKFSESVVAEFERSKKNLKN